MQQPPPVKGSRRHRRRLRRFKKRRARETSFSSRKALRRCCAISNKPHGLLNMTGMAGRSSKSGVIPTAFVTGEGFTGCFSAC